MFSISEMYRSARCLRGQQRILAALVILGSICAGAGAQIDVNETGLHDGEGVYGLHAPVTPIPYVNVEDITVLAWGELDPDLYTDVSLRAYGLFTDVNVVNSGAISVTGAGGAADANELNTPANAQADAYGICSIYGLIANGGRIHVEASGGTALSGATDLTENASAAGWAYGLYAERGAIENTGRITITAQGGRSRAEGGADTKARAYGVYTGNDEASNSGDIMATAIGGTADTSNRASGHAIAMALSVNGDIDNTGNLTVAAIGGTATTDGDGDFAYAHAFTYAVGIFAQGMVNNSGNVTATATGGTANANSSVSPFIGAFADADVSGIFVLGGVNDSGVNNSGSMTVTATGGTAVTSHDASAYATAHGIWTSETLNNSGNVNVTAIGGTATGSYAHTTAQASGLSGRNLTNSGAVTVRATGGAASAEGVADASSYAEGIAGGPVTNTGVISVTATAGTAAGSNVLADADAVGITADGDVYNSGAITATAQEGFTSSAYGIQMSYGNLTNTGIIRATAIAGTGTAGDEAYGNDAALAVGIGVSDAFLDNSGHIGVGAQGGSVTGGSYAQADAHASGIQATSTIMSNSGAIAAMATGGTATPDTGIADANAYAYGVEVFNGNVNNSGAMTVIATGGTADANHVDATARANGIAYGVYTTNGLITNGGRIDVEASGGTALSGLAGPTENASASGQAYGLYAESGAIENTGRITITARGGHALAVGDVNAATTAYGVFTGNGNASNSGDMTVTAIGGTADTSNRAIANAFAKGLYLLNGDLDNTGDLTVAAIGGTATTDGSDSIANLGNFAYAYGVYVLGMLNNSGNVTVTATSGVADDTGPFHEYHGAVANAAVTGLAAADGVNNSGNVTVAATGGIATSNNNASAEAQADGIHTFGALSNSGNVAVTATGGTATGYYASAGVNVLGLSGSNVTNTGTVTVVATAGTATASEGARVFSLAEGIAGAPVTNTGDVFVTAAAGTAPGYDVDGEAYAVGISTGDRVYNSGDITVAATAREGSASQAYGIRTNTYTNVTNTGVIRATADTAYELYVASDTAWLVDIYNVTLDGDPNRASFGIANGATLGLNNATLSVTGLSRETRWNTPYKLFETQGTGVVYGDFGDVRAANPNTTVMYYDQGTDASVDDAVALAYTPVASPALASGAVEKQVIFQAGDVVTGHMTTTLLQHILNPPSSGLLASASSTAESLALAEAAPDKTAGVFVEPYYSRIDKEADPLGFDASLWGFSAGCERFMENTILSLHLGYGQSDIEYTGRGYSGNSEDQDIVTGGFSALTRWDPWTLRYGLTGFYGQHDYEGLTGLALDERETASFDSYGTVATLMAGRVFQRGRHVLLPEAGLTWLWAHRERYTTEATDPSWDTTYSALNDHDVQAAASLRWLSSFLWHDIRVSPSLSLGVRHLLTVPETNIWQSVDGVAPVLVRSKQDRTAVTLSGSLLLTKTPHAVSLAYDGDYSPDAQRHSFWLRYSWLF